MRTRRSYPEARPGQSTEPRISRLRVPTTLTLLLCAVSVGGCLGGGGGSKTETGPVGRTLTVYSSLPRHGVSAARARAVAAGQRLALRDVRAHVGRFRVRLKQLDSTRPEARVWDPALVSANAKLATDDPTAIAYLGELDYGATAVSLPLTNDRGLLQISPEDGLTSLTRVAPGSPRQGPERYYPSGRRTFLRLTPSDLLQAKALLRRARRLGVRQPALISSQGVYGRELAGSLLALSRARGLAPVHSDELDADPARIAALVTSLKDVGADGIIYAGVAEPTTRPLLAELARQLPDVPVLASGGVAALNPAAPMGSAPARVEALTPILPPSAYPPEARRLLRRLAHEAGRAAARIDALYGYESMRIVLQALRGSGGKLEGVVRVALAPGPRRSPLGLYQVRASGDSSARRFALLRLKGGRFQPVRRSR